MPDVGQSITSPQIEGALQSGCSRTDRTRTERLVTPACEFFEAMGVDACFVDGEQVTATLGSDPGTRAATIEHLAEFGDIHLQSRHGSRWRFPGPEPVDQPVPGNRVIRIEEQKDKEVALTGTSGHKALVSDHQVDRS